VAALSIRSKGLAIAGALLVCLAIAWAVDVYAAPVPLPDSPRNTVVRYFLLISQTRDGEAMRLTAGGHQGMNAAHGLVGLKVGTGTGTKSSDPIARGYRDPIVYEVSYFQFAGNDTESPGPEHWFVAVGRENARSPWRIVSFASGW
jgi:hypothetical protein